jgi:hypothetical protein
MMRGNKAAHKCLAIARCTTSDSPFVAKVDEEGSKLALRIYPSESDWAMRTETGFGRYLRLYLVHAQGCCSVSIIRGFFDLSSIPMRRLHRTLDMHMVQIFRIYRSRTYYVIVRVRWVIRRDLTQHSDWLLPHHKCLGYLARIHL